MKSLKIVFLYISVNVVFSENILYITPVASPSHHIWNRELALGLVEKGHNITMLGHDFEKHAVENFTMIVLEGVYKKVHQMYNLEAAFQFSPLYGMKMMQDRAIFVCSQDLRTKGLAQLLAYPNDFHFALIIFDVTCGQCLYPLIQHFNNPPVVAVTPFLLPPALAYTFGNHLFPSYIPFYNSEFTDAMDFGQRVLNFIYVYADVLYRKYVFMPALQKELENYFENFTERLENIEEDISILLSNVDPILHRPMALGPNVKAVGGLHIKPVGGLPQNFREIMDVAENGVILFSLGTNIRSERLEVDKIKSLLAAFKKLPQTVLWKFDAIDIGDLPKNVIISKWLPQNEILGHHNTVLFISHGGTLSVQEAIYHGVPIIGAPFLFDQRANVANVVQRGIGKALDFNNLTTSEYVYQIVSEVLLDPVYRNNIQSLSKKYRDRLQAPLEKAVFWAEYVLRHGSVHNFNLSSRTMLWYQVFSLDVILLFAFLAVFVLYILYKVICIILMRKVIKKGKQKVS